MAEAVLFNLATDILKLAGSITLSEIQLVRGARDELDSLKDTIETIRAVLLDAEKQQWHNNQVKLWLARLKDVLYDVQDLLDDVATEDLRRKVTPGNKMSKAVRVFFSKSNQPAHRRKVAKEIQELRKRLDRIKKDREFHLEEHPSEETMAIARGKKPESSKPDEQIIGRKKDKENIKRLLFDSSSSDAVSFVAIVGKGGLGKTALARLVYNDGEVEEHFDLKMWVCVSDVFDVHLIIKEILKSANCQDYENKPLDQLQRLLQETLGKKKYLLVLDDMWNEVRLKWLELGDWLKGGEPGSKILITTRSHMVAKVTDEKSAIYDLQGLSTSESWDLFREVAFGDRQASVDQRLEEMGRDIVRKCAGVPLAIRTIGSLLYGKKEDQWNRYRVKELPEIPELDAIDNGIMQVLKFSYDRLPSCLKHCFAYCSLFPKDYVYDKEMMIHLWMAQGFIESLNGEDNLEDVADNYLSELVWRSFLDAANKCSDGKVKTFKMHDLMHDLAQKVAGGSANIRVGLAQQDAPFTLPHCIARYTSQVPKPNVQDQMLNSQVTTVQHMEREKAYDIIASLLKIPFLDEEVANSSSFQRKMGRVDGYNPQNVRKDSVFAWTDVYEKQSSALIAQRIKTCLVLRWTNMKEWIWTYVNVNTKGSFVARKL
ncbi:hypothetical protein NL676_021175 [Syzygium grande]|nr:hypothetical protein NL676_021175 [Syzygium grande]